MPLSIPCGVVAIINFLFGFEIILISFLIFYLIYLNSKNKIEEIEDIEQIGEGEI